MRATADRLKVLIKSTTPLVLMETVEETRALIMVRLACSDLNLPLFEWSIADGLYRSGTKAALPTQKVGELVDFHSADATAVPPIPQQGIYNTQEPQQVLQHLANVNMEAVFLLKDFHRHMENAIVVRRMRDLAETFSRDRRTMILVAPELTIPPELETLVEFLDLPLPEQERMRELIEETYKSMSRTMTFKRTATPEMLDDIAHKLAGLTEEEAERTLAQAMVGRYGLVPEIATDVHEAKQEILRRTGMLDFVENKLDMKSVGGLENLKAWLKKRRGAFEPGAREFGLDWPKGVIILGVQGCGKSLCARAIAGEWQLPLVRLNTAHLYDKYVGETEKRVAKMFQVAEQLAPVVLWVDELEKVFAGSGPESASADSGVSARMLGQFLSWLQDRKTPVFIAATSNNVHVLPPELIRKGRFDEIFFVDLPNDDERRAIFTVQLQKRKRKPEEFDIALLVKESKGFSGAEIETAVQSSMFAAFSDKQPMKTEYILQELKNTVPLSVTRAEEIERLRAWARERAVAATAAQSAAGVRNSGGEFGNSC